jgi:hypothetical protein
MGVPIHFPPLQDQLQANPAIKPFILCPKQGAGCSRKGVTNVTDAGNIISKCEVALRPRWRSDGTPSVQPCSVAACQFNYRGSSGSFTVKCSELQGSAKPVLPFFNPGLCITGSKAQQALKVACKRDRTLSDLCVSSCLSGMRALVGCLTPLLCWSLLSLFSVQKLAPAPAVLRLFLFASKTTAAHILWRTCSMHHLPMRNASCRINIHAMMSIDAGGGASIAGPGTCQP